MKHTGYTPGPWRYTSDGRVFGCCAHEWNASLNTETQPFIAAGTRNQADLDLIADAPRLAEENERLRALLVRSVEWINADSNEPKKHLLACMTAALAGEDSPMKLVRDNSAGAHNVNVPCLRSDCKGPHRMLRLSDALIDIEGPSFRAYYHQECINPAPVRRPMPCEICGGNPCLEGCQP